MARLALQMNGFAAAIAPVIFALDPAFALEASEKAGEGRLFDAEPFGEIALCEVTAREVSDGAPFRLAQTKRLKALIELVAPDPCRLVQELSDGLGIDLAHR